jgi:phospholipase/lecithinase/hemolysin
MFPSRLRPWSFAALLVVAVLLVPSAPAARRPVEGLVVFGTSLSDPGNAFALTHATSTPPYATLDMFLVPSASYATGGQHFSNGATWIERLAQMLGLPRGAHAAFRSANPAATNFAIGASRALSTGTGPTFGLQVAAFLARTNDMAPTDALYVAEMGGNDVRDAVITTLLNGDGNAQVTSAVDAIGDGIAALYAAGARRFFVWNSPNIALTPAIGVLDGLVPVDVRALALGLTLLFNATLQAEVLTLETTLPGIEIILFDAFQTLNGFVATPALFGLSVVDAPCVTPNVPPFHCDTPDEYVFWDGVHPTKAVHALLAEAAADRLWQP